MAQAPVVDENERNVLRYVASGRHEAVEELFRTYSDRLFRYVYSRVGQNREDAEEVTQDAFLTAIKLSKTFKGDSTVFVWLCGIANLRIKDYYRRTRRNKRVPHNVVTSLEDPIGDRGRQASQVLDDLDRESLICRLLGSLSEQERECMMLRYGDDLSVKEIAQLMKRSEKAVESLLIRAKRKQRAEAERWLSGGQA